MRTAYVAVEPFVIAVFVGDRIRRRASSFPRFLGKLDHLIDGLFSRQPVHEIRDDSRQFGFGFARVAFAKGFDHHRYHDFPPTLAYQRQRSIEIKEHGAIAAPRNPRVDQFDVGRPQRNGTLP